MNAKKKKNSLLIELFCTFLKIGLFTFGGGYAMISIIEGICVEQKRWITHDEMMNVTVIAESTPGPIAINCATFVGYRQAGLAGAVSSTVGVVVPSFVIIYVISMFLNNFLEIAWIASAFRGIKIAVGVLILNAALNMLSRQKAHAANQRKASVSSIMTWGAFAVMLLVNLFALDFSTISLLVIAAAVSLALCLAENLYGKKGGEGA